jgi:hypothetical protein
MTVAADRLPDPSKGLPERPGGVPPALPERLGGVPPTLPERLGGVPPVWQRNVTRTRRRRIAAGAVALALAVLAFVFRFNALGGALGGFDDDEFYALSRANMLLHGEQPLRDWSDTELRGVWPALSFELPALVQRVGGDNLFAYACFVVGALALSAAMVFLFGLKLSGGWGIAVLAALVAIASMPWPYTYHKVIIVGLAATAIHWTVLQPTTLRLAVLALWTVAAALFRHDFAVYVAFGAVAGLIAVEPRPWQVPARRVAIYAGLGLLAALPSIVWVMRHAGIGAYLTSAINSVTADRATHPSLNHPVFDWSAPLATDSLGAFLYYAYWLMPAAGLAVLVLRGRQRPRDPMFGTGLALILIAVAANYFFLRSGRYARLGDAIVPAVLLACWIAGAAPLLTSRIGRLAASLGPAVLLLLMGGAFFPVKEIPQELRSGSLTSSPAAAARRFTQVRDTLRALPPKDWSGVEARDTLAVSRYVAECTAPDDYVLVGLYGDPIPYFARRRFAGGMPYFAYSFLKSETDQRLTVERLSRQSVPIAIVAADYEGEIVADYPIVARYLEAHYREAGVIDANGEPYARVWVRTDRQPARMDPVFGFPCFR